MAITLDFGDDEPGRPHWLSEIGRPSREARRARWREQRRRKALSDPARVAMLLSGEWNEADHPREPAGTPNGGQFADATDAVAVHAYHGTTKAFDHFDDDALGSNTGAKTAALGHFFTDTPVVSDEFARGTGGNIRSGDIVLHRPFVLSPRLPLRTESANVITQGNQRVMRRWDRKDDPFNQLRDLITASSKKSSWKEVTAEDVAEVRARLISAGYDGIVLRDTAMDAGSSLIGEPMPVNTLYIVFQADRIKHLSADWDESLHPRDDHGRFTESDSFKAWFSGSGEEPTGSLPSDVLGAVRSEVHSLTRPPAILGLSYGLNPDAVSSYLEARGQEFTGAPRPKDVPLGEPKNCFKNASLLVMSTPGLRYAEGIAYKKSLGALGFLHAWAVTPDGTVIDPTWSDPEQCRYFGVVYDRKEYLRYMVKQKFYGVLGGDAKAAARFLARGGVL